MEGLTGTWVFVGALPWGELQEPDPQPIPRGQWVAPLSPKRVRAGKACVPPGRCQSPHNGAPGVGARPAHSAPNNHCSAAAGPAASRGGRTGGQQMGPGCRISSLGLGGGQPRRGQGRGSGSSPPAAPPSLWSPRTVRGTGLEGGLSAHHHCHLEQGRGETGPKPGLS